MLLHGGDITAAVNAFGIPAEQWLDLSTGINPRGWQVPPVPADQWQRLPTEYADLVDAARDYYGFSSPLPVAGSQAAIQSLPRLMVEAFGVRRVGIVSPCYEEHLHAWARSGCELTLLDLQDLEHALPHLDLLLLCNPNNPDGRTLTPARLMQWHEQLRKRKAWLVVDEAFVDCTPELSLAGKGEVEGLILLRSLGKFFGLAGARVGFLLSPAPIASAMKEMLGPWSLPGPSAWVATQALRDQQWQQQTRDHLLVASARLERMLLSSGLPVCGSTPLFHYLQGPGIDGVYQRLARQGILLRRFPGRDALRIGLPGSADDWSRLGAALQSL